MADRKRINAKIQLTASAYAPLAIVRRSDFRIEAIHASHSYLSNRSTPKDNYDATPPACIASRCVCISAHTRRGARKSPPSNCWGNGRACSICVRSVNCFLIWRRHTNCRINNYNVCLSGPPNCSVRQMRVALCMCMCGGQLRRPVAGQLLFACGVNASLFLLCCALDRLICQRTTFTKLAHRSMYLALSL